MLLRNVAIVSASPLAQRQLLPFSCSSHLVRQELFMELMAIKTFLLPGLFSLYLVKLEEVRAYILEDMYGISPCTMAPVDTLIDSCFEYSILVNLLVVSKI